MLIVELGLKLNKNFNYYDKLLKNAGAINCFTCETHDIYWTNKDLTGMSENEMKRSCIRLRKVRKINDDNWNCSFQNYNIFDSNIDNNFKCSTNEEIDKHKQLFEKNDWKQVFDTYKKDYQYVIGNMKSRIQLQDIKDVGLLLYYDNPDYYNFTLKEQRKKLIDELNSYGFNFSYNILGLDKLRTLYYKEDKYSINQNG